MTAITPDRVRALARAIHDAGGRALIVGGWVRDEILGATPKDLDLEVFGLAADRLRSLLDTFGRVDTVGESFTVYKLGDIDVSLPRRESKIAPRPQGLRGARAIRHFRSRTRRDGAISRSTRSRATR